MNFMVRCIKNTINGKTGLDKTKEYVKRGASRITSREDDER